MTYQGTVKNGVVVIESDAPPPEGTRVRVSVESLKDETIGEFLRRYAGVAKGLPADMAAEHDHYAHGAPKRSER
ncbi:MAG: hypothetical protein M3552_10260 [Planctomycetota bacterium]|nr:hypothetical protein [Planctomycetota bacterium]